MLGIVRSELVKILTLPSVWAVTAVLLVINLVFQYQSLGFNVDAVANVDPDGITVDHIGSRAPLEGELRSGLTAAVFNPAIFAPVLGAVMAGAEFRAGQLGLSVLAVPDRTRLMLAKVGATLVYSLGFGLVCAGTAVLFVHAAARDWDPGFAWSPGMLAAAGAVVLFLAAITQTAFAITLMSRRVLVGVLVMGGFLALTMTQVLAAFSPPLDALTPFSAARNMLLREGDGGPPMSSGPEFAAMVLIGWVAVTAIGATAAVKWRDAR